MPQLVFFDLDGTITRRDTLTSYVLRFVARRPWRIPRLLLVVPALCRFVAAALMGGRLGLRPPDHGALKGALIHATLGGLSRADIEAWNAKALPRLLERGVFPEALAAIASHRAQGDHLVLMSASVDLYVPDIGRRLGFDATICSGVRWHNERLDGHLATPNRRGQEKTACVKREAQRFVGWPTCAYGNSWPDLPHLAVVDRGVLVNASLKTQQTARALGIECRPWS